MYIGGNIIKKYKVAFLHNIIAPYRIPLFEGLANHPSIDLSVFFCADTHKNRKWDVLRNDSFDYEILSGTTLEYSSITFHVNPSIILKLINGKYDVVVISGNPDFTTYVTFIVSKFLNIPTIWWSEGIESSQSKLGKIINPLTKYIVQNVDAVIVPGSMSRDFHVKMGAIPEKIFVAPNIVDNNIFIEKSLKIKCDKKKYKPEFNIANEKIILFIGQLIERKGVEYLIDAYKILKDEYDEVCLVIIGDGDLKNQLEESCVNKQIKDVHFTGWVSEEDKIAYYSIADLFVLPTRRDVWGLVINEAMCCGLPVISTKAAGCAVDMIKHGENGFIVDVDDEDQLYSAMKEIILNDGLAKNMSEKSLEIIKSGFTLNKMIEGFISAIESSITRKDRDKIVYGEI